MVQENPFDEIGDAVLKKSPDDAHEFVKHEKVS
jgi:hypothetical protein